MKKRILLKEKELKSIICYALSKVLNESATPLLYHYIDAEHLCKLLEKNAFRTCEPEMNCNIDSGRMEYTNGDGVRFISLTRNPNPTEGYPIYKYGEYGVGDTACMCRLTIDGNALNTYSNFKDENGKRRSFKVKPFDWMYHNMSDGFGAVNGKEYMFYSNDSMAPSNSWKDKAYSSINKSDYGYDDKVHHPYSQAEDRLTTKSEYIPNANKYIKKIDILFPSEYDEEFASEIKNIKPYIRKIKELCEQLNIPLRLHNNIKSLQKYPK